MPRPSLPADWDSDFTLGIDDHLPRSLAALDSGPAGIKIGRGSRLQTAGFHDERDPSEWNLTQEGDCRMTVRKANLNLYTAPVHGTSCR